MEDTAIIAAEKPQNGLAGLKHWRHDLLAGLVVSMVSVPFSLGIAVASAPPHLWTDLGDHRRIGIAVPGRFLRDHQRTGGQPVPALLAGVLLLGKGDLTVGYPLLLVAICLTGLVQLVLAYFKAARFSAIFPSSVVEGMLASIGLLIIAKQLPLLLGHSFHAHEFWGIVAETPSQYLKMEPKVFVLGISSLALLFVLASIKTKSLKVVPPPVFVAIFGLIMGQVLGLNSQYMIHLPDHPFADGMTLPNFHGVIADPSIW